MRLVCGSTNARIWWRLKENPSSEFFGQAQYLGQIRSLVEDEPAG